MPPHSLRWPQGLGNGGELTRAGGERRKLSVMPSPVHTLHAATNSRTSVSMAGQQNLRWRKDNALVAPGQAT